MDLKNFIVAIFIIVIVLSVISILPTGYSENVIFASVWQVNLALLVIAFALFSIAVMLSKKNYYPS
jgi:hypothetical protein